MILVRILLHQIEKFLFHWIYMETFLANVRNFFKNEAIFSFGALIEVVCTF